MEVFMKKSIISLFLVTLIALFSLIGFADQQNESTNVNGEISEQNSVEIAPFNNSQEDLYHICRILANDVDLLIDFGRPMHIFTKHFIICRDFAQSFLDKKGPEGNALEVMVLKANEVVIGFITYYTKDNEDGWIDQIGIDHNQRKKGYGTLLMNHAMTELRQFGKSKIKLHVKKENEPAQKLYQKLGFVQNHDEPVDDVAFVYEHQITSVMC
jgi:ribosomal protein S18 acetylase RimI-like enzyme